MDELNALRWFRQEVDHLNTFSQSQDMREILGENYKPRYERLLHFIPFSEFEDFDGTTIGHGKFGEVFAATWHRPKLMENRQAKYVPVVLKRVLPTLNMSERKKLEKFLREVRSKNSCFSLPTSQL
jgi:hypothetical protein